MSGEMAVLVRIVALALLCFVIPNPGSGSQSTSLVVLQSNERQTTSSEAALEAAIVITSAIRTSPVVTMSTNPLEYAGKNGVASINSSSISMSMESPLSTKASTTKPPLHVGEVSATSSSVISKSKISVSAPVEKSMSASIKMSTSGSTETPGFIPSKPLASTSISKTQSHTVIDTVLSSWISSSRIFESPTSSPPTPSRRPVDYKLILCVVVPLFTVLVFVIVIAMVLCVRRYRRLRRYRQHLVPLTDMDGSDDSDEEDQISDKEPVFMVSSVSSSARPILSFENEND